MFPREIVDLFVQAAHDEKIPLAPLLLVNQTFRLSARTLIFHHTPVTIYASGPKSNNDSVKLLGEILQDGDPEILHYIKHLTVQICADGFSRHFPAVRADSIVNVLTLLTKAPNLSALTISCPRPGVDFKLCCLSPTAIDTLIALRSLPSLRQLTISGVSLVPPLLLTGTSPDRDRVEVLKLLSIQLIRPEEFYPPPEHTFVTRTGHIFERQRDDGSGPPKGLYTPEDIDRLCTLPACPWFQRLIHLDVFDGPQLWSVLSDSARSEFRFDALKTLEFGDAWDTKSPDQEILLKFLRKSPAVGTLCLRHRFWGSDVHADATFLYNNLHAFTHIHTLHLANRYTRGSITHQIISLLNFIAGCGPLRHIRTLTTSFEWHDFTSGSEDEDDSQYLEETITDLDTQTWPYIQQVVAEATPGLQKFGMSLFFDRIAQYHAQRLPLRGVAPHLTPPVWVNVKEEDMLRVKKVMDKWSFEGGTIEFEYKLTRHK